MIRPNFFSSFFNSIDEIYHYKAIQKSILMSAGAPYGRIVSSILKKLSLGQLNIEHFNAQTQTLNSLPRNQRSQQENSTNPEDGHVWKDEWRTRGYSRWPLTNSQFGKFLFAYFKIFLRNLTPLWLMWKTWLLLWSLLTSYFPHLRRNSNNGLFHSWDRKKLFSSKLKWFLKVLGNN